ILPAIKHADALELISSCSALVLPSRSEGMGRVLLEAMAAAKPIIASRVGGIPHYLRDGENGFLSTAGSIPELGARLLDVLRDPKLARRLVERGRHLATTLYDEAAYVGHFGQMFAEMGLSVPIAENRREASQASQSFRNRRTVEEEAHPS